MSDEPTLGEIGRRLDGFRAEFSEFRSNAAQSKDLQLLRSDVTKDLSNVAEEIRLLRVEHIRRDVYDANRITDQQRIFSLEEKIKSLLDDKRSYRMLMWSAVFIAVASFLFNILGKVLFK